MKHQNVLLTAFSKLCAGSLILLAVCAVRPSVSAQSAAPVTSSSDADETKEQRDARMKWWRESRFGMFIHWGVYSVPAGVYHGTNISGIGEWIQNRAKIPLAEYQKYPAQFNPTKFSADYFV